MIGLARATCRALILTLQKPGRKGEFIKLQTCMIGLALCLATSLACFAKPREVFVTDEYDGVGYNFADKVAKAVARDKKSKFFRIVVYSRAPSGWDYVSALYNRKQKTLKIHSYSDWLMSDDDTGKGPDLARRSHSTRGWIYRNVTDAKLQKLAAQRNEGYIFGGNDRDLTKLKIRGHQLYEIKSRWNVEPNGKLSRARWAYNENTQTYRYPKR